MNRKSYVVDLLYIARAFIRMHTCLCVSRAFLFIQVIFMLQLL